MAICTVTATCATPTPTPGRTIITLITVMSTRARVMASTRMITLTASSTPSHLVALALAGAVGFAGNWLAALVRSLAGRRLDSPPLIADGDHARVDAHVSLAVIASALAIAAGTPILDPLIGLGMTVVILRIARESWRTVRGHHHH
jgi:divalent metal cation (Fe/Co/Zn/Cd) transporter